MSETPPQRLRRIHQIITELNQEKQESAPNPPTTISQLASQFGKIGGDARAKSLSAKRRREIAVKAGKQSGRVRKKNAGK